VRSIRMPKSVCCAVVLVCLGLVQVARANDVEEVPLDELPPKVLETLKSDFKVAEIVAATRDREGDRECFTVTIIDKWGKGEILIAANGGFWHRNRAFRVTTGIFPPDINNFRNSLFFQQVTLWRISAWFLA